MTAAASAPANSSILPDELLALGRRQPRLRLLDVRTPGEFESLHIPGAYNVPVDCIEQHIDAIRTVRDPIVIVCQSGQRAYRAAAMLAPRGADVRVLEGGMIRWSAEGGSVVRGPRRLPLERQVRIAAGFLAAAGALLALLSNPLFALVPLAVGSGLVFAGVTNRCGMAMLLTLLPWNRPASIDVEGVVDALRRGAPAPAPTHDAPPADAAWASCATG